MNGLLFDGRTKEQKISEAIQLLVDNGYVIRGPYVGKSDLKGPADLVKFFYNKMEQYSPDQLMAYSGDRKKDLSMSKGLLKVRMEQGMSLNSALLECATLIEALFKYENRLGLDFKVTSMSVLGQDSMAWVTKRLIDIINGYNKEIEEASEQAWFDSLYIIQEENIPEDIISMANERLGLKDNNGKEKD